MKKLDNIRAKRRKKERKVLERLFTGNLVFILKKYVQSSISVIRNISQLIIAAIVL